MTPRIVAFVDDLMDRSRLGSLGTVVWASAAEAAVGAEIVIVDVVRHGAAIGAIRALVPGAHVVAYGPHVDEAALATARAAGADLALARSRFFADPAAALARGGGRART